MFLSDLRRSLLEMRSEAVRKMMDYQRELQQADKDVAAAEKKLAKSKEQLDRMLDNRSKYDSFLTYLYCLLIEYCILRLESFEIDIMNPRNIFNRDGKSERVRETEDLVSKCEKEIRSEVRLLLHAIGYKDQLLAASRRAYQKLDAECKRAVAITLQKIVEKEKDYAEVHRNAILKLEQAIEKIDVENDINEFVENNISNDGSVVYSSRALSLLSDLVPQVEISSAISSRAHSPDISDTSSNTGTASTPAVQTPVRKPSFVTNFTKQRKTSKSSILDNSGVFKTVESDDDQEERDSDASTTERKGKANSLFGAVKDFAAKPKVKSPTTTPISPGTNATVSSAVADADKMQEKAKIDSPLSFQISSHLHTIFYTATSSSPTGLSGSIDEEGNNI